MIAERVLAAYAVVALVIVAAITSIAITRLSVRVADAEDHLDRAIRYICNEQVLNQDWENTAACEENWKR